MTTKPNDSAMPCGDSLGIYGGLTKREYFAAMAMQGICANASFLSALNDTANNNNTHTEKLVAFSSVEVADALIAELNKEEK